MTSTFSVLYSSLLSGRTTNGGPWGIGIFKQCLSGGKKATTIRKVSSGLGKLLQLETSKILDQYTARVNSSITFVPERNIHIYIHGSLCSRCARMINIVTYVWRNDSGLRIKAYLVALKSNDYRSGSEFLFFLILNSLILTFCESNHREARPLCPCACATNAAHAASRQTRTRAIIYLSRRYCLW